MIVGVVLAAGTASRMGRPKQLLPLDGRPLAQHVIDAATASGLEALVVVLGHRAEEIRAAIRVPDGALLVENPGYRSGLSSSLQAGLRAAPDRADAAVILLADQPGVDPDVIDAVIAEYRETGGPIVRTVYTDGPGHPVLIDRAIWAELESVEGDEGARPLMERDPGRVVELRVDRPAPADIDTPETYERIRDAETEKGSR